MKKALSILSLVGVFATFGIIGGVECGQPISNLLLLLPVGMVWAISYRVSEGRR